MRNRIFGVVLCILALCATGTQLMAQTETGQIVGNVLDPSGASIPGATVTVKSLATGGARTETSDAAGGFAFANLLPATYEVTATASGFATFKQNVEVTVGSRVGVDVKLEVGKSETVVEVAASAVVVNTETQTITQDISTRQVLELPSLTRNPYDFVVTSGNVSPDDPSGRGVGYAINGLRSSSTNIMLDGVANNDEFTATVGQAVPLDSVQEYSIVTNNFTAEYGRASAGVVNVATKSGTNDFHGTLYEFLRASRYASNDFNSNAYSIPKPHYTRNQFGYSIGGPIVKNKLFFFSNTEWTRVRSAANNLALIPDPAFIAASAPATQAVFSAYGALRTNLTPLGTISRNSAINTLGQDPCEGGSSSGGCAAYNPDSPIFDLVNYVTPANSGAGVPQNTWNTVNRIDYQISNKTQLYGRYAIYNEDDFVGTNSSSPFAAFDSGSTTRNNSVVASITHTFSPRLVSQTKVDFNRFNGLQPLGPIGAVPSYYLAAANAASTLGPYNIALPGFLPYSPGNAIPFGGPQNFAEVYEDLSYTRGKHQFRFGGQFTYIRDNRTFGAYEEAVQQLGTTDGGGLDNFLAGQLHQFQAAVYPQGKFPCINGVQTPDCTLSLPVGPPNFSRSNRYREGALYAQDAWKASRRLTLNLGVRWEYFGPQHNKNSALDSNFYPPSGIHFDSGSANSNFFNQIVNGQVFTTPNSPNGSLWTASKKNFAPRVGFAYDLFGDGKTSIRGGYGIGYERNFGNVTFNVIQNPPNYAVISITPADVGPIPISVDNAGPLAGSSGTKKLPRVSLRAVNTDIPQAYAHLYSFSIEREVGKNMHAELDYSGSIGENQYDIANLNINGSGNVYGGIPCDPGSCFSRLNPQYGAINFRSAGGHSTYNAMNLRYDIQDVGRSGLTLRMNYTWSHAIDNLSDVFSSAGNQFNLGYSNPYDPNSDKGDANFDNRHRVVVSAIWNIPFAKHMSGPAKYILDGWEIAPIFTARTGAPYTIYDLSNCVCYIYPRVITNAALPSQGNAGRAPTAGTPNSFNVWDFSTIPTNDTFVNPITGDTDWGPYPAQQTGRNSFRNFGSWNIDAGIYKNTKFTERLSLQLRLELYNAFNHANFSTNVGSAYVFPLFGGNSITGGFSGNRNLQLGAKVVF